MIRYKLFDIDYDEGHDELPSVLFLDLPEDLEEDEIEHELSEYISNETGFCHKGFNSEVVSDI